MLEGPVIVEYKRNPTSNISLLLGGGSRRRYICEGEWERNGNCCLGLTFDDLFGYEISTNLSLQKRPGGGSKVE